jgi:hypothetical protein
MRLLLAGAGAVGAFWYWLIRVELAQERAFKHWQDIERAKNVRRREEDAKLAERDRQEGPISSP